MVRARAKRCGVAAGVVGLVASALAFATPAEATVPVPPSQSGAVEVWGAEGEPGERVPARSTHTSAAGPWAAIAIGDTGFTTSAFAIDSAGKLRRVVDNGDPTLAIPSSVSNAKVAAISHYQQQAAAVTADGAVHIWGSSRGVQKGTIPVAQLGAKAVDVAVGTAAVAVLLADGRVGWLQQGFPYEVVDAEVAGTDITDAAQVDAFGGTVIVRVEGGGLLAWDQFAGPLTLKPEVAGETLSDPIVDFDVAPNGGVLVAATASGQVYAWGEPTSEAVALPAFPGGGLQGDLIDVAATASFAGAVTDENEVVVWGPLGHDDTTYMTTIPEEVEGQPIASIVSGVSTFAAIVSAPLPDLSVTTPAKVSGTPKAGNTLTGTPAVFAGSPDSVANAWFEGGTQIATGTKLALTAAHVGKTLTFKSTATRGGDTLSSESAPVGPIAVADPKVTPTVTVSVPRTSYGQSAGVVVRVVASGKPISGTVTLSGAGATQRKAVGASGVTFVLPKTLAPRSYRLTAAYSGNAALNARTVTGTLSVGKGRTSKPTLKVTKKPTRKKAGKATVTVKTPAGLTKASGKVTVTLKKGKKTKKVRATIRNGKVSVKLPKLAKGTYKAKVVYGGNGYYVGASSKTYTLKVKR